MLKKNKSLPLLAPVLFIAILFAAAAADSYDPYGARILGNIHAAAKVK